MSKIELFFGVCLEYTVSTKLTIFPVFENLNILEAPSLTDMISLLMSKHYLNELFLLGFVIDYSLN
jgi:hypothetical protein